LSERNTFKQFSQSIVDALEDKKAIDLIIVDVRGHSQVADRFIIASGRSGRHLKALAQSVTETAHGHGLSTHIEGMEALEWLLIDLGDIIIHLFLPEIRQTFQLEKLWAAPVSDSGKAGRSSKA